MTGRITAIAVSIVAIALVVAQDVAPRTPLYHTWQYALALAVALFVLAAYANGVRRGEDGRAGKRLLIAVAGAAIVDIAGLASGLLGPDTATVIGTPGTVVPVPALGAAAFFAPADAGAIARGQTTVVLRRRNAAPIEIGTRDRRPFGESLLYLEARPAAFIDAWDANGAHLTVTQPTNASFLSPVVLFRSRQRIGGIDVPFDTVAFPGRKRVLRTLYFTAAELAAFRHDLGDRTRPGLILSAADDRGTPLGITFAQSGNDVTIAGVRVRATIGTFPALAIASAPPLWAPALGIALFAAGVVWSQLASGRRIAGNVPASGDVGAAVVDADRPGGRDRRVRDRADDVERVQP